MRVSVAEASRFMLKEMEPGDTLLWGHTSRATAKALLARAARSENFPTAIRTFYNCTCITLKRH